MQSHLTGNERHALPRHFAWIDGLRGVAAVAVVIFHYHHFYLASSAGHPEIPLTDSFPWAPVFGLFYDHGYVAVQLFWVISGFVFAHVYFNRPTTYRGFIVARFARLYPLHFATLILVAALQLASLQWAGHWQIYGHNDLRHFILQLFMSSNWTTFSRGLSFNGPIWSVSLEIVAYILFLFALPLLRRFGLIAAVALTALMWWLGLDGRIQLPGIFRGALICAGYFFLGNCAYLILQRGGPAPWAAITLVILGSIAAGFGYVYGSDNLMLAGGSVAVMCAVALMDLMWRRPTLAWLKRLGDMSYSIYLVHVPLQMIVLVVADVALGQTRAFATSWLTLPIYLLVVIVIADLTYRRFEIPVSRALRRKLNPGLESQ